MWKREHLMKCISIILITSIPLMSYPFTALSAGSAGDSSTIARIKEHQEGNRLIIDQGCLDGVDEGMTGLLRFPYKNIDGSILYKSGGLFEVIKVYKRTSELLVKNLPEDLDLKTATEVLFPTALVKRSIDDYPCSKLKSTSPPPVHATKKSTENKQIESKKDSPKKTGEPKSEVEQPKSTPPSEKKKEDGKPLAKEFIRKSEEAYDSGDYKEALEYINKALEKDPDNVYAKDLRIEYLKEIQAHKKDEAVKSEVIESNEGVDENFVMVEEFRSDCGFWFTTYVVSELSRRRLNNNKTVYTFTPKGFNFSCSGVSPTSTVFNRGANDVTVIRDNLTEKLSLSEGKSILTEGVNKTLDNLSKKDKIRKEEWKETLNILGEEHTGIQNFTIPISFGSKLANRKKSLIVISFESEPFVYRLKNNISVSQKFKGFAIMGADKKHTYCSAYKYEGRILKPGKKQKTFSGQQIGYLVNPINGKAVLRQSDVENLGELLTDYPRLNSSQGSFRQSILPPPKWFGKIFGISRLLQVNASVIAENRTNFLPIAALVGAHIIDGAFTFGYNYGTLVQELATGKIKPSELKKIFNRLTDSDASLLRRFYEAGARGWVELGANFGLVDPSNIDAYSKIAGELLKLPGDFMSVNLNKFKVWGKAAHLEGISKKAAVWLGKLMHANEKLWGIVGKADKFLLLRDSFDLGKDIGSKIIDKPPKPPKPPINLGTVALGAAAAGGAVYGTLKLVGSLDEDYDIRGTWNFHIRTDQYGSSSGVITIDGDKTSGRVHWGGGYYGPYQVDGKKVLMTFYMAVSVQGASATVSVQIPGEFRSKDYMEGTFTENAQFTTSEFSTTFTLSGSWSAGRID